MSCSWHGVRLGLPFVALIVSAGCATTGRRCDADQQCEGQQRCFRAHYSAEDHGTCREVCSTGEDACPAGMECVNWGGDNHPYCVPSSTFDSLEALQKGEGATTPSTPEPERESPTWSLDLALDEFDSGGTATALVVRLRNDSEVTRFLGGPIHKSAGVTHDSGAHSGTVDGGPVHGVGCIDGMEPHLAIEPGEAKAWRVDLATELGRPVKAEVTLRLEEMVSGLCVERVEFSEVWRADVSGAAPLLRESGPRFRTTGRPKETR